MTRLQQHIDAASVFGTHRIIVELTGVAFPIKRLMKALSMKLLDNFSKELYRIVWFKTTTGMIVLVAGNRFLPLIVERHFEHYNTGAVQEFRVVCSTKGTKTFAKAAKLALADYVPSYRSYASSR